MYHCECSAEGCGLRHLRVLIDVGMVEKPVALDEWRDELEQLQDRLGEGFVRPEPRQQAGLYLEALLSSAERKKWLAVGRTDRRCPALAHPTSIGGFNGLI